ncbi:MAG: type II toxin-antitoxin system Phd/YefM family antitoxin [Thermodesulfobacteriota bacterium]|nr:type II toxin-antitoxin system Phd/YefM family antitoxin [Thermodesulfobacteriota bacterium]
MSIVTISSREFNQDVGKAKKNAMDNTVIITDRGKPAHVLLSIEQYQQITGSEKNILDMLAMPSVADIEFDPPQLDKSFIQPADMT